MGLNIKYRISSSDSRFYVPDIGSSGSTVALAGLGNPAANSAIAANAGTTSSLIDVINEMPWTISKKTARVDVPVMNLVEYQQTTGQLIASIIYFGRVFEDIFKDGAGALNGAVNDRISPYRLKYFGEPTGFRYRLPYFNSKNISRTNTFGTEENSPFSSVIEMAKQVKTFGTVVTGAKSGGYLGKIGTALPLLETATGVINSMIPGKLNFEFPQSWNSTDFESYTTTFDLFNVLDEYDYEQNRKFCHLISYQNSPSRRNFAIMDPPVIYSLSIPGIVQLPVCYVSNLEITNLGNTRLINNKTIPEAYRISLTFTSLLLPSRNIMEKTESGDTVDVIGDISPYKAMAEELFNKAYEKLKNVIAENTPSAPLSPADLKRGELYNGPTVSPADLKMGELYNGTPETQSQTGQFLRENASNLGLAYLGR